MTRSRGLFGKASLSAASPRACRVSFHADQNAGWTADRLRKRRKNNLCISGFKNNRLIFWSVGIRRFLERLHLREIRDHEPWFVKSASSPSVHRSCLAGLEPHRSKFLPGRKTPCLMESVALPPLVGTSSSGHRGTRRDRAAAFSRPCFEGSRVSRFSIFCGPKRRRRSPASA